MSDQNELIVVHSISRTLSSLLDGVANASMKCINYPNCIGQSGGAIGITDAGTIGANAVYYAEKTIILIIKIIGVFSDTIAPVLEEALFGDLANKPWSQVAPIITRIINEKKDYLDEMSRNPEIQAALKEWAEAYATIGIQTMMAVRPSINKMIDEGLQTLSDSGTRATTGVVNLGLNLIEGAVGEIPVAGGIIDVIVALVRGVNNGLNSAAPLIQFGTEAIGTGYATTNRMIDIVQKGKQRVEAASQALQSLNETFKNVGAIGATARESIQNIGKQMGETVVRNANEAVSGAVQKALPKTTPGFITDAVTATAQTALANTAQTAMANTQSALQRQGQGALQQSGGAMRKKIQKKISKTTRRIKKTLYKFNGAKKSRRHIKS